MLVWYRCTRKGCNKRLKQPAAASYVGHQAGNGDEHPMKREEAPPSR